MSIRSFDSLDLRSKLFCERHMVLLLVAMPLGRCISTLLVMAIVGFLVFV
jgi:hypothetical protein